MYYVEYDPFGNPIAVRRVADGYLIYLNNLTSAEGIEFVAWNKAQTVPLDLVSKSAALTRQTNARANAKAIPSWSSWTETETLTWIDTNIGQPLVTGRANLPATLTLATARAAIVTLIGIMDKMLIVLIALARMVVAMRNQIWPDLQDK